MIRIAQGVTWLFLYQLLWSSTVVINKWAFLSGGDPSKILFIRFCVALPILLVFNKYRGENIIPPPESIMNIMLLVIVYYGNIYFYYTGLRRITTIETTIWSSLVPIVTILLNIVSGRERLELNTLYDIIIIFGVVIALGSCVASAVWGALSSVVEFQIEGTIYMVIYTFSAAAQPLVVKQLAVTCSTTQIGLWAQSGVFLLLCVSNIALRLDCTSVAWNMNLPSIIAALVSGVLWNAVGFSLTGYIIQLTSTSAMAFSFALQVIMVTSLAILALGEEFLPPRIFGVTGATAGLLIVVGVTFLKHHTTTPPGGATTHIITPEVVMEDGSKTSPGTSS